MLKTAKTAHDHQNLQFTITAIARLHIRKNK